MKRFLLCALLLLFGRDSLAFGFAPMGSPAGPAAPVTAYDLASFTAELHRISDLLARNPSAQEITALRDSLPKEWNVTTPDRTYAISTESLRDKLAGGPGGMAKVWVDHMAMEVEGYSARGNARPVNAKAQLDEILAGAEFAGVRPPSAWENFRQRLVAWLQRLLVRIFGGLARYPIGGQIVFWLAIVIGVVFIALCVFRVMVSRDHMDALQPSEILTASRTWQEWMCAARDAARQGDFREAVHSAYWAAIARLEDMAVLPKDRTKTPREYLRIASDLPADGIAPSSVYREPLAALTARLEKAWYANRGAGADDFKDTLRHLEALGCRLE